MQSVRSREGILSQETGTERDEIVELLKQAYFMELETVMNYVSDSVDPKGVKAQKAKESLEEDIQEKLGATRAVVDEADLVAGVRPQGRLRPHFLPR